jgi:hypothetical protein
MVAYNSIKPYLATFKASEEVPGSNNHTHFHAIAYQATQCLSDTINSGRRKRFIRAIS